MNKIELNDWLQILGMFGVIASLIFVGLQMRQSQQIALAGQVQARAEMLTNRSLALMEGEAETYYNVLGQALIDPSGQGAGEMPNNPEISDKLQFHINNQVSWAFGIMTNTFYHYNTTFFQITVYFVMMFYCFKFIALLNTKVFSRHSIKSSYHFISVYFLIIHYNSHPYVLLHRTPHIHD